MGRGLAVAVGVGMLVVMGISGGLLALEESQVWLGMDV